MKNKEDVVIALLRFSKNQISSSNQELEFSIEEMIEKLKCDYSDQELEYAKKFVKAKFDRITGTQKYYISMDGYMGLLNYDSLQLAKKGIKKANIALIIAIISIVLAIISTFFDAVATLYSDATKKIIESIFFFI